MDTTHADHVIVGAGSAGCALAARLTEHPDIDVRLLPSGIGEGRRPALHLNARSACDIGTPVARFTRRTRGDRLALVLLVKRVP
jgi:choline dehydrogenase-like flavoprotein